MIKAFHAQENREAALANDMVDSLRAMKLRKAAALVDAHITETLTYYGYLSPHWLKIRTNNPMERLLKEARR